MDTRSLADWLPEPEARYQQPRNLLLLTLAGYLIVSITELVLLRHQYPHADVWSPAFAGAMAAAFAVGFALRSLRRKVFMGRSLSFHMAMSFEAIFQGATLLNPQLPFPAVEQEFLHRQLDVSSEAINPWFRVRPVAAVAIPLGLAGAVLFLAGMWPWTIVVAVALLWFVLSMSSPHVSPITTRTAFVAAILIGVAAAVLEGLCVVRAAHVLEPSAEPWRVLFYYTLILTTFELTPIPLAIGSLELVALAAWFHVPGSALPLVIPLAYRLWRGAPLILLTLFYLPRYKLSLFNLYDPLLPLAIARTHRPEGGWHAEIAGDAPLLSIVIPAYNEEARLPGYLPAVIAYAEDLEGRAEILVVNDGSTDGTADYVRSMQAAHGSLQLIDQPVNQGKGMAVRHGVEHARGQNILFTDADGATPIDEADKLLELADEGFEVVIGSRRLAGSSARRTPVRDLLGTVFCRLTNILAVPAVSDTQCGFKLFRYAAAERIFPLVEEKGWVLDVEVLFLAQKFGMGIAEVPVMWSAQKGSKVSPLSDSLKMLVALLRIRRRHAGLTESLFERAHRLHGGEKAE